MRSLRQDPDVRIRLAFFVVAVIYNFTEAAFRATCSIWFVFLLATTAVPLVSYERVFSTVRSNPVLQTDIVRS
jgi:hypothetical protein